MQIFTDMQGLFGVTVIISNDVKTRFDSTLEMFESIWRNREVLTKMQDEGLRKPECWPSILHLTPDDFDNIHSITKISEPVRFPTKTLPQNGSRLGPSVIKSVHSQKALECALEPRLKMIISTQRPSPSLSGTKFAKFLPNEYVVDSYLIPRHLTEI